uniref:Uncharacterized protein n=1 Tax=mine drainage metagenome TaxID=410659 RepID=E6QHM9_9ZZZZ
MSLSQLALRPLCFHSIHRESRLMIQVCTLSQGQRRSSAICEQLPPDLPQYSQRRYRYAREPHHNPKNTPRCDAVFVKQFPQNHDFALANQIHNQSIPAIPNVFSITYA